MAAGYAIERTGAMKTGMIYSSFTLITLFAYVTQKEPFTSGRTIAVGGMLCGVYLLYKE